MTNKWVDILSNKLIDVLKDILGKVSVKYQWIVGVPLTISAEIYIGRYIDQVSIVTLVASRSSIQLFRQRLAHKSVTAYTTMPISIMSSRR